MTEEKFRKEIMEKYRGAMQDCQIPTGALAHLNPAEFYAYCLKEDVKHLKEENKEIGRLKKELERIRKITDMAR